jgi:hypothetical protein
MKTITFFTIHQAPHNSFTFKNLEEYFRLNIFYYKNKLNDYNWDNNDFYYQPAVDRNLVEHIKWALKSDLVIISGWHNRKYILLILLMLVFRRKFALYSDLGIDSLRKYGLIKKIVMKMSPFIFITGIYGEKFLRRYLRKENVYSFPYGIKCFSTEEIMSLNTQRIIDIRQGDRIRVFISNRFIERKGYHLVRSLLSHLKQEELIDNFQFIIAGNGPLFIQEKREISKISSNILFLGWIDYSEYRKQIMHCDIYLQCSDYEPYGIPLLDAFVCRKDIISTKKIYSKYDIIEFGGKIYEFDYRKEEELHSIFKKIAQNHFLVYNLNNHNNSEFPQYLFGEIHHKIIEKALNS